jgi:acyl-coenzyme A thioesterase PaaI-like protein
MSERESKTSGPDPGTETGARERASEKAEERVRESFARQGLMGLLSAQIVRVGHGTCEIEVPFRDEITEQQRYFHGAVAGMIGDSAGGYAALTLASEGREVLTVEYKINFLAPAWGTRWWPEGRS